MIYQMTPTEISVGVAFLPDKKYNKEKVKFQLIVL